MAEASFDTTIHEHDGHQRSIVVAVQPHSGNDKGSLRHVDLATALREVLQGKGVIDHA